MKRQLGLLILTIILFTGTAIASETIYVSQTSDNLNSWVDTPHGQNFTTTTSQLTITGIDVRFDEEGHDFSACVYSNPAKASLLGCVNETSVNNFLTLETIFTFASPITVTPSTSYYFEITNLTASTTFIADETGNPYASGMMFINGVAQPNEDLYFIVYGNGETVGTWTLNEGTGTYANDTSGFNNNGTITSSTWATNLNNGSVNGTAINDEGTGSILAPSSNSLNLSTGYSFTGWIKRHGYVSYGRIFSKGVVGSGSESYNLIEGNDEGEIAACITVSGTLTCTGLPTISTNNTWEFISIVYNNSALVLYSDNTQVGQVSVTGNITPYGGGLYLSSSVGGSIVTRDEFKIFNYALNSTERTTEYQRFQPVPAYPVGGLVISATVPPMTSSIDFSWHDTVYPSDELIVASDSNFNLIVADVYTSADTYTVSLVPGTYYWKVLQFNSTTSTFGSTSATQTFTISGSTGATGTGIDGVVYELINTVQTPISDATVTIYNSTYSSTQTTGSNGYYLFTGLVNSSTYNIVASKQGYDTTTAYPVTTGNGTVLTNNILMKIYISPYVPNFIFGKFIVRGLFDNAFPGVTVNVYEGAAITPKLTGTTDSVGQVVFQLIKDKYYRVTFSGGGLSNTITIYIYAKEESYLITVASGFPTGGDRFTDILTNLTVSTVNSTYSNLSIVYNDTRSSTTALNFYATNLTNNTTCTQSSTSQVVQLNCTVLASGSYQFGFNATSSIYGFFQGDKVINFGAGNTSSPLVPTKPPAATVATSTTLMQWASIMLIVLTAALFSVRTVKFGAVIVPFEALVLQLMGWFQADILLLLTAMVIGVLVYMRLSEVKVNY